MNPFDWSGPAFLQLYLPLALVAVGLAIYWRSALRTPHVGERPPDLHPYEVAHLVGGPARVVDTALAHLAESGVVAFDEKDRTFSRIGELPRGAHSLEKALVGAMRHSVFIGHLRPAASHEVGRIRTRLEQAGLELTDRQVGAARWYPLLPLIALVAFGLIKLAIGLERDKPVGFLVLGSVALVVIGVVMAASVSRLSVRGRNALAAVRERHAALQVAAAKAPATLTGPDLTMAVCLFGPMVLAGGPLMPIQQVMHGQVTPGGAAYSGNSCSSSCGATGTGGDGGGGDAGGGDGGGGGCGGCGGGGGD